MILGSKVRELRERLGMSQAGLARLSGVQQPTIAAIESGGHKTARNLPRIAEALSVEISELDPDYPQARIKLSPEHCAIAYEVMLEFLRPDLAGDDRQALARLFLDLAQEPLDDKIGATLADQLRLRVGFLIRPYRRK